MGLFDSILGAVTGKTEGAAGAGALVGVLGTLLSQNGGLQGLASKFSDAGHGNAFSSWVGNGSNQPISSEAIQQVLGSEQVKAIAGKMGIDPSQASGLLAQYLPQVVDKLTPQGAIDPNANHQQGLASILPGLLQSFGGMAGGAAKPS